MQAATVKELKDELKLRSPKELIDLCLRLSRFKKENKELLTYLLFESEDEEGFIRTAKSAIDDQFEHINTRSFYYIRKSLRKILREVTKYGRYSQKKATQVELLIHFCQKLKEFKPSISRNRSLKNLYHRQIEKIEKLAGSLHEDLQYDVELQLRELRPLK